MFQQVSRALRIRSYATSLLRKTKGPEKGGNVFRCHKQVHSCRETLGHSFCGSLRSSWAPDLLWFAPLCPEGLHYEQTILRASWPFHGLLRTCPERARGLVVAEQWFFSPEGDGHSPEWKLEPGDQGIGARSPRFSRRSHVNTESR